MKQPPILLLSGKFAGNSSDGPCALPPAYILECYHHNPKLFDEWGFGELARHLERHPMCRAYLRRINEYLCGGDWTGYAWYRPGTDDEWIRSLIEELYEREEESVDDLAVGDLVRTAVKVEVRCRKTGDFGYHWTFLPMLALLTEGPVKHWEKHDDCHEVFRCYAVSQLPFEWDTHWCSKNDILVKPGPQLELAVHTWLSFPITDRQIRSRIGRVEDHDLETGKRGKYRSEDDLVITEYRRDLYESSRWLGATARSVNAYYLAKSKAKKTSST